MNQDAPNPEEFERFIKRLLDGAPEGYQPWLFRCGKESKAPALEFGSWKEERNRLTPDEAADAMREGFNIGISGMENDRLVNVDVDDPEAFDEPLKPSLEAVSRSRVGRHGFYFEEPGEDIPNIPLDESGEVRAQGQYVLTPGSYVPAEPEDVPDGEEDKAGCYTVENAREPASITFEELPELFKRQARQADDSGAADVEPPDVPEGDGQSALFDVTARDVAAREGASTDPSDRWESAFHGSTTGSNMSLSNQGLIQCWRHGVAHNGLQALAALSDYPHGCEDVGTPHKNSGAGPSCIQGDDAAIWHAWKFAKANGYIPDDDPVPYRALVHICRERDLCPPTELPDGHDPEEGETIPAHAYDAAISSIKGHDGLDPGREKTAEFVEGVAATDGGAASASGGASSTASPEEPDGPGDTTTWDDVRALFDSDANGTTTKGYAKAVEILEREYTIVTIRDSEAIYFYDEFSGFYRRKGQTFVRELIEGHLGDAANENRKREILNKWRDRNFVDVDDFKPPKGKVNVENCVLDLDTREKEEHTPDYYFTNQLNVKYNPDAEGGLWVDQLERAVRDPDEIEKLEQFVGYCLETWHHEREKNMFFVGKSRTGKSTIQEAIQALFGDAPTVTSLTPQQLADTQFDAAALFEAALNTVNDINASKINDSGSLKRMFSGERTKMENKYEDHFFAEPNAKHLFTANWLPRIVGTDEAIWRRILIIEFTDQLTEAEKDRTVKRRLKEKPEVRQVILNRALDARDKLNDQDHFTADRSMKETRELWDSWRTNNKRFLYSHFEVTADPDDEYEKRTYWQTYNEWCAKHGYEPASNRSVTKELGYVPGVGTSDDHHYTGLRWADDANPDDDPGQQTGLGLSQDARKRKVREIIENLSENGGAANVEQVKGYAAGRGLDVDQVENDIENWLRDGTISEAGGGEIYIN